MHRRFKIRDLQTRFARISVKKFSSFTSFAYPAKIFKLSLFPFSVDSAG